MPTPRSVRGACLAKRGCLKAVSGKGAPTNNLFVFDAATGAGTALRASPFALEKPKPAAPPSAEDAIEL